MRHTFIGLVITLALSLPTAAMQKSVDLDIVNKIRDEGFHRSQVMETLSYLSDEIGPRLTGSPALRKANRWTAKKLGEWGLENTHSEGFNFGPGWTPNHAYVHMTSPKKLQLYALPIAWHPGTNGVLEGEIFYAPMKSKKDFEKYEGKLAGKIVLVDKIRAQKPPREKAFRRHDEATLSKREEFRIPKKNGAESQDSWVKYLSFHYEREQFLAEQGAIAMIRISPRGDMLIEAGNYQFKKGMLPKIPAMQMASDHYNQLVRTQKRDHTVSLAMDIDVTYHTDDMRSYSTFAEIPGRGRHPEIVMAGGHLDSWLVGTGATDDGAGVAVVMEAIRILKVIGVKPVRTIRIGLWGGEEQGYYGSQQYVMDHLADRPTNTDPALKYMGPYERQYNQFPITPKDGYERFSVYFNLDNGGGKIRGVYAEGNAAAASVFQDWLKPFHDLGAKTVSTNTTGGTDHVPFDDIGLPGFQFIQDPLDYSSRTHHTQVDVFDKIYANDMKQASVIMATFLYNAAMRTDRFPRKPAPQPTIQNTSN